MPMKQNSALNTGTLPPTIAAPARHTSPYFPRFIILQYTYY